MPPAAADQRPGSPDCLKRFLYAHAEAARWQEAVDRAVAALGAVPATASLGFVYVTDHFAAHFRAIVARLRAFSEAVSWVGTVGVGICATGIEYHDLFALRFPHGQDNHRDLPPFWHERN